MVSFDTLFKVFSSLDENDKSGLCSTNKPRALTSAVYAPISPEGSPSNSLTYPPFALFSIILNIVSGLNVGSLSTIP